MVFNRTGPERSINYRVKSRACQCRCQLCHMPNNLLPYDPNAPPQVENRKDREEVLEIDPSKIRLMSSTLILDDRFIGTGFDGRRPLAKGLQWLPVECKQRKDFWTKYEAIPIGVLRFVQPAEAARILNTAAEPPERHNRRGHHRH